MIHFNIPATEMMYETSNKFKWIYMVCFIIDREAKNKNILISSPERQFPTRQDTSLIRPYFTPVYVNRASTGSSGRGGGIVKEVLAEGVVSYDIGVYTYTLTAILIIARH